MDMFGVGKSVVPQLMAEIRDLRRFAHQKSLVVFMGTALGKNQSGDKDARNNRTSKRGSTYLRKTLFVIMTILL